MSSVSLDDPKHVRRRVRLNFILRIASDEEALYLAAPAIVGLLLPPIRIPWSEFSAARFFDASGWVRPPSEPGTFFQLFYDPGYTGKFVELEISEPKYFLQLPAFVPP
jgi:hypothetical protein